MPVKKIFGHTMLYCINDHGSEYDPPHMMHKENMVEGRSKEPPQTTMMRLPDCGFIGSVTPPVWFKPTSPIPAIQKQLSAVQQVPTKVHPETGIPVRIFRCSVCGYLEMYASQTVDPALWGVPDGH
jgi:hypothetical protein